MRAALAGLYRRSGEQKGQALVELALALPVLLLLVMGSLDLGWALHSHLVLTSAIREGARLAAVGGDDAAIRSRVKQVAANLNLTDGNIAIAPGQGLRASGTTLSVTATHSVKLLTPFLGAWLANPLPLTAQTVMRVE